jgi:hypothetical protein
MKHRLLVGVALAIAMAALPGSAQSVAQQLEKGVYAQQTAGDLDGAIRIFREIVASNPAQRVYAAQAQMHLAQALLQKGDLSGAAQEFNTLAANYSEFRNLVAGMAGRVSQSGGARSFSLGDTALSQNGPDRYTHRATGVSLTAPAGWKLDGDTPSSNAGDMVMFTSSGFASDILSVWLKAAPTAPGTDILAQLRKDMEVKGKDRTSYAGWKVRPESVRTWVAAGQPALSAVADYSEGGAITAVTSANGQTEFTAPSITVQSFNGQPAVYTARASGPASEKMVEYMIWVRSLATHAFFFGRAKAADLAALQSGMDQLAATAVVP